jgi:hypothetical protein
MTAKKEKIIKIAGILFLVALLIGGGTGLYLFNMPHRNVLKASTDYSLSSSQIVAEYLVNSAKANEKYLSDDGDSKILEIYGTISKINEDFKGQKVILLQSDSDKAGVSCTFTLETNQHTSKLKPGDSVTIKGVIRSGASYDSDLEFYENVIIEKCDLIKQ